MNRFVLPFVLASSFDASRNESALRCGAIDGVSSLQSRSPDETGSAAQHSKSGLSQVPLLCMAAIQHLKYTPRTVRCKIMPRFFLPIT